MNARALLPLLFCITHSLAMAQGFAELGQTSEGYALPDPATRFTFPDDHGSHPEFRIEWWYVTANLKDAEDTDYGVQWTLFRIALSPNGEQEDQMWMGHAAVSTPAGHLFTERLARGGIGQAGVTAAPFEAFIDEWRMAGPDLATVSVTAQSHEFRYDLDLSSNGPFVPQGEHGFSVKSFVGQASHYYSQPFYSASGTLTLPEGEVHVTGRAWLDREWSSQPLAPDQTGWDWVSLHLSGGKKLMVYRLRDLARGAYVVGTWIAADGIARAASGRFSRDDSGQMGRGCRTAAPGSLGHCARGARYRDSRRGDLPAKLDGHGNLLLGRPHPGQRKPFRRRLSRDERILNCSPSRRHQAREIPCHALPLPPDQGSRP